MEFVFFCSVYFCKFCFFVNIFLDLSFWFDEMHLTDWRGQWTRQLCPIYFHWREKEKKDSIPKKIFVVYNQISVAKNFLLMLLLDHGPSFVYNNHKRVFTILCFGHFPVEFRVWIECFFIYFSGLRIKWKQTRCGGVTRDEWNVVSMTRGWNVKESRAVRLKVGLLNEETAKMNKVRP